MTAKRIALWGLLLAGAGIAAAGFILTPDFLKANLPADEVGKLTDDVISTVRLFQTILIACGILLMAVSVVLYRFGHQVLQAITNIPQLENPLPESTPNTMATLDLFMVSFLGLFFEILIVRWLSTEVRLFAYYKNLPLIAAFTGLGIGFMLARKSRFFSCPGPWWQQVAQ